MIFEKNVDQIVGVFTKTITQLEGRRDACRVKAQKEQATITEATTRQKEAILEARRADTLADKLKALVTE